MKKNSQAVDKALEILRGQHAAQADILELSLTLKREKAFNYARRILELARRSPAPGPELSLKLDQQYALCTYKDQDLPLAGRLDEALRILREGRPNLLENPDQETLGIAGAIYKRKWEADGQKLHLERSLAYYRRAYRQGTALDNGYTGINAAFVLDLLAQQETNESEAAGVASENATRYRQEAKEIREKLVTQLPPLYKDSNAGTSKSNWWLPVTIAEAYYGLQQYEQARPWLQLAVRQNDVPEWQLETTTKQLARLAALQQQCNTAQMRGSIAWEVLQELTGGNTAALQTAFAGKVGLALSGGGFRASLYHIGVLARLAELDVLRHVEVLSCVSGGSIIGTYYYLEVRNLLQLKPDHQITQQDYIAIVDRISRKFLESVQQNIRTRIIANWGRNLRMLWDRNYSRTERIGELYEQHLYAKIKDGEESKERWLNGLFISPMGVHGKPVTTFTPKYDNWRRAAKVPILILNATTLNTGHNWQFTASWMGESPASIQEIDGNYRLRRMYYKTDGPSKGHRKIRLGHAVAASACVPGLFPPLELPNLYEEKVIRLVDGGVHDNQGICGLLEQDCAVLLISDASGQINSEDTPGNKLWNVPMRANNILMERVRNAQYQDMAARLRAGLLKGLMFVHLKLDLDVETVDWINCEDPSMPASPSNQQPLTSYGIRKDIQQHLAAIRTDLDSFNDTEAHALMASGYLMTKNAFSKTTITPSGMNEQEFSWSFSAMANQLKQPDVPEDTVRLLQLAKKRFMKGWNLRLLRRVVLLIVSLILLAYMTAWVIDLMQDKSLTLQKIITSPPGMAIGAIAAVSLTSWFAPGFLRRLKKFSLVAGCFLAGVIPMTVGWLLARLHLLVTDKLYLRRGKLKQPSAAPAAGLPERLPSKSE